MSARNITPQGQQSTNNALLSFEGFIIGMHILANALLVMASCVSMLRTLPYFVHIQMLPATYHPQSSPSVILLKLSPVHIQTLLASHVTSPVMSDA